MNNLCVPLNSTAKIGESCDLFETNNSTSFITCSEGICDGNSFFLPGTCKSLASEGCNLTNTVNVTCSGLNLNGTCV